MCRDRAVVGSPGYPIVTHHRYRRENGNHYSSTMVKPCFMRIVDIDRLSIAWPECGRLPCNGVWAYPISNKSNEDRPPR